MNSKRKKVMLRLAGFLTAILAAQFCSAQEASLVEAKSMDQMGSLRAG